MPRSVLVVDDDIDQHRVCGMFLEHAGYRVLHAYDGEQAIEVARAQRPGVVLMDLRMPRMDGIAARRQMAIDPETRAIPVVAVTADVLMWPEQRALAEGFAALLPKPCSLQRIRAVVGMLTTGDAIADPFDAPLASVA